MVLFVIVFGSSEIHLALVAFARFGAVQSTVHGTGIPILNLPLHFSLGKSHLAGIAFGALACDKDTLGCLGQVYSQTLEGLCCQLSAFCASADWKKRAAIANNSAQRVFMTFVFGVIEWW